MNKDHQKSDELLQSFKGRWNKWVFTYSPEIFFGFFEDEQYGFDYGKCQHMEMTFICLRKIPCYFGDNSAALSGKYLQHGTTQKMKIFRKPGFRFHFCYFNNYQQQFRGKFKVLLHLSLTWHLQFQKHSVVCFPSW